MGPADEKSETPAVVGKEVGDQRRRATFEDEMMKMMGQLQEQLRVMDMKIDRLVGRSAESGAKDL